MTRLNDRTQEPDLVTSNDLDLTQGKMKLEVILQNVRDSNSAESWGACVPATDILIRKAPIHTSLKSLNNLSLT